MTKKIIVHGRVVSNFVMTKTNNEIQIDNGKQQEVIPAKDWGLVSFRRVVYERGNFVFVGNKKDLTAILNAL